MVQLGWQTLGPPSFGSTSLWWGKTLVTIQNNAEAGVSTSGTTSVGCGGTGENSGSFACECGRRFGSQRGLSQHRRKYQAVLYNSERRVLLVPKRGIRWSSQGDERLGVLATDLSAECATKRDLYNKLLVHFPGRTEDALKKRLQKVDWGGKRKTPPGGKRCGTRTGDVKIGNGNWGGGTSTPYLLDEWIPAEASFDASSMAGDVSRLEGMLIAFGA